jgi:hypothetical protein
LTAEQSCATPSDCVSFWVGEEVDSFFVLTLVPSQVPQVRSARQSLDPCMQVTYPSIWLLTSPQAITAPGSEHWHPTAGDEQLS